MTMRNMFWGILLVGIGILMNTVFFRLHTALAAPDQPSAEGQIKIGFINLKQVFDKYVKTKRLEQKIEEEFTRDRQKIQELEEQLKNMRTEIELYRVGSEVYKEKENDYYKLQFELQTKKEWLKHAFVQKMKTSMEEIYQRIIKETEEYAQSQNYYMVIKVDEPDFFGSKSIEDLTLKIGMRDVLYWSKKDDITKAIIARIIK